MIYTSNFARSANKPGAISIARFPPRWFRGDSRLELAPPPDLLSRYKTADVAIGWEEYAAEFRARVLSVLDPVAVAAKLPEGAILLCWCPRGGNCHRNLVAEWLRAAGVECREVGGT